jgi:hypothetical protein
MSGEHELGIPDELVSSFLRVNRPGRMALSLIPMRWQYDVTSEQKIKRYSELTARRAANLNGGALVYLSRVGFNDDHSEALFCAESYEGLLFYMRFDHGSWQVVRIAPTWLS